MIGRLLKKFMLPLVTSLGVFSCSQAVCAIEEWNMTGIGYNISCKYDTATGHLSISGNGKMPDCFLVGHDEVKKAVSSVTIGDSITKIAKFDFCDCKKLSSVTIPDTVEKISDYVFQGCTSLKDICIPVFVTEIGGYAFAFTGLENVTIPQSVERVGVCAFAKCHNLENAEISNDFNKLC